MAFRITKYKVNIPGEAKDEDQYNISSLSKLEAMAIASALRLSRQELIDQIRKSSEMETMTDEGKIIEDLRFLGAELSRVCAMEFELGEQVEM